MHIILDMGIDLFLKMSEEDRYMMYAKCLGNTMSMAESINREVKKNGGEEYIRYGELLDYFDGLSEDDKVLYERARLIYLDKLAVDVLTDKNRSNAAFLKDVLSKRHPDYLPKKEINNKVQVEYSVEHIMKAAKLSGSDMKQIEADVVIESEDD